MKPEVSIIIPAYNAEKTIKRCLESIFAQDFDSYEVILINDGSIDGTLQVARVYEEYPNFVLINQPNGGVARARWAGILASKGNYLAFVDSDDFIAQEMISKMYSKALETEAEIVVCGLQEIGGDTGLVRKYPDISESGYDASVRFFKGAINGTICDKLFKKGLIREKEYLETLDLSYGEDALLVAQVIPRAKRVSYLKEKLYYRVNNPNSVTRNPPLKALEDYYRIRTKIYERALDSVDPSGRIPVSSHFVNRMISILRKMNRMKQSPAIEELRKSIHLKLLSISIGDLIKAGKFRQATDLFLERLGCLKFFYFWGESCWFKPLRFLIRKWRHL